jgi:hypothetical protein
MLGDSAEDNISQLKKLFNTRPIFDFMGRSTSQKNINRSLSVLFSA